MVKFDYVAITNQSEMRNDLCAHSLVNQKCYLLIWKTVCILQFCAPTTRRSKQFIYLAKKNQYGPSTSCCIILHVRVMPPGKCLEQTSDSVLHRHCRKFYPLMHTTLWCAFFWLWCNSISKASALPLLLTGLTETKACIYNYIHWYMWCIPYHQCPDVNSGLATHA